ncbi:MAG: PIN domain-containing protein [Candidatus Marsarchaeota archaeon]|nr:PIN domain-containing protein [Candidatus Marsarchaeota archaeon]
MLLDTSAWIELFKATKNTGRIKEVLTKEPCYTSIVTIAEIVNWAEKEKRNHEDIIDNVGKASTIIGLNESISVLAGRLNFERKKLNSKLGMLDSFILATAMTYGLRILTKDSYFGDLQEVEKL